MALREYRIVKNQLNVYKLQTKGWLYGWNDWKEYEGGYAGGDFYTKYFQSFEDACKWKQAILKSQQEYILSDIWEVVIKKCSSTLISKEQSG